MKWNKKLGRAVWGLMAAIMFCPMVANAQVPEEESQSCICIEKCEDKNVNEECPVCSFDYRFCEGKEPEVEPPKEEESYGPLTPDGNLTLVDDYGSFADGGKQFITVVTKNGNYFYIIIDRDDNGNESVHFLNMVDESDLFSLMDEEEIEQYLATSGIGAAKEEPKKVEKEEPVKEEPPVVEQPKEKQSSPVLALTLMAMLGLGGAYFFVTKIKGKKEEPVMTDPDADYDEDEEDYLDSLPKDDASDADVEMIDLDE